MLGLASLSFLSIIQPEMKFCFIRFYLSMLIAFSAEALSSKSLLMHYRQIFWLVAIDSDGFDIGLVCRLIRGHPAAVTW